MDSELLRDVLASVPSHRAEPLHIPGELLEAIGQAVTLLKSHPGSVVPGMAQGSPQAPVGAMQL
jgi:hypothetical protein